VNDRPLGSYQMWVGGEDACHLVYSNDGTDKNVIDWPDGTRTQVASFARWGGGC
jgi:hypothetical protein